MSYHHPNHQEIDRIMLNARKLRAEEMKRFMALLVNAIRGLFSAMPGRAATR